jgi:hypothetical protein
VTGSKARPQATRKNFQTNLELYAENCLRIVDKEPKLRPLTFNLAQRTVHDRITRQLKETGHVRAIILKARQEGVSTYSAARFFRRANLWSFQNCVVIADKKDRASKIFGMYERMDKYIPEEWREPKEHYRATQKLFYENGSRVSVETANDVNAGRADTIHALHATELPLWENAEDVWVAMSASIPDKGSEIIIEATAQGVGNLFHNMWLDAVAGEIDYVPIFLPWWIHEEYAAEVTPEQEKALRATLTSWEEKALDVGLEWEGGVHRLSIGNIAWRRATIRNKYRGDERKFQQEYPATADEAFLTSGNPFFDPDALNRYIDSARPAPERVNLVYSGDAFYPMRAEQGSLRIWEHPRPDGHYVIGADTATGRQVKARQTFSEAQGEDGGKDFCCADVFDVVSRSFVAQLHGPMAPEVFADQLAMLGRYYSNVGMPDDPARRRPSLIAVEMNHASGETVNRILKDDYAYRNLYYHRVVNKRMNKITQELGWHTNVTNRQQMLDDLAQALRENQVHLPNPDALREFSTFVRNEKTGKPEASEGTHDDRVISAAISLQVARDQRPPRETKLPEIRVGNSPTGLFSY